MPVIDTVTPATADELAAVLQAASAEERPVVPLGAGTHQYLGAPPPADALHLGTAALDAVLEYAPADLTATVQAGVPLRALQAQLARNGQWLPWDPPGGDAATVGGLLAAGLSGPLRLGYGTPRDWVLGMRVVLGDGRLVKSGGRVVKNVAGYDAHKLHLGALGTLGVIAEATFKLAPLPERVATLAFACPDRAHALALAQSLRERPLSPVSLAVTGAPAGLPSPTHGSGAGGEGSSSKHEATVLLARFAGVDAAVARQLHEANARARAHDAPPLDLRDDGTATWSWLASFAAPNGDAAALVLRAGVRPSSLAALADELAHQAPPGSDTLLLPGIGLAYARSPMDSADLADSAVRLAALRARIAPLGAYVVVEAAPPTMRAELDLWGPPPPTIDIMRRLKAAWDPRGILNPGRYVGGL
jgi:glycolate oxidase FAD binding subunit